MFEGDTAEVEGAIGPINSAGRGLRNYHEPITKKLRNQLAALEDRRVKVQALLDLIESNPQFEQLYDLTREVL